MRGSISIMVYCSSIGTVFCEDCQRAINYQRQGWETHNRPGAKSKHDLFSPGAVQPRKDILVGNVLHSTLGVVFGIVLEDDAVNLVGGPAQPALLNIVQDHLDLGLGAGDVCHLADRDAQRSAQESAKVRRRVGKLVGLAVALVEGDEDAHVVLAGKDLDRGAGELGRDLIEAPGRNALFGTGDMEGAHRRVVGGLLGEVRDADGAVVLGGAVLRYRQRD